mgnify:CR=1 FL=1
MKITDEMITAGEALFTDFMDGKSELSQKETVKQIFIDMLAMSEPEEAPAPITRSTVVCAPEIGTHRQRLKALLIDFELPFKRCNGSGVEMMEVDLVFHFDNNENFQKLEDKGLL